MPSRSEQIAALSLPLEQLPDPLPIPVIERPFDVTITPPGSKSIANRALLLAALAEGTSTLTNVPAGADDVRVMIDALRQLGAAIDITPSPLDTPGFPLTNATVTVTGVGGQWKIPAGQTVRLNLGGAGTAVRFLTAAAILAPPGTAIEIDGDARMRERPIGQLVEAMRSLGMSIGHLSRDGCPPFRMERNAACPVSSAVSLHQSPSSQFISGLVMAGGLLPGGLTLDLGDPDWQSNPQIASPSYVKMTLRLIGSLGAGFSAQPFKPIIIRPWRPEPFSLEVETDASSCCFWGVAAAICPSCSTTCRGFRSLAFGGLQPDANFEFLLLDGFGADTMGSSEHSFRTTALNTRSFHVEFADMPDAVMPAAILALFATENLLGKNDFLNSNLYDVHSLRLKESDRLAALQTELARVGGVVTIDPKDDEENLCITPPRHLDTSTPGPLLFHTYNDHRMAMSLALIGLRRPNVSIANPRCVAKSYPTYWRDLARLYV